MSTEEEKQRLRRLKHAKKLAKEISTWSAQKLRNTYAQPDRVKAAEDSEKVSLPLSYCAVGTHN